MNTPVAAFRRSDTKYQVARRVLRSYAQPTSQPFDACIDRGAFVSGDMFEAAVDGAALGLAFAAAEEREAAKASAADYCTICDRDFPRGTLTAWDGDVCDACAAEEGIAT